jgi:predicted Zn-dependent peptidase
MGMTAQPNGGYGAPIIADELPNGLRYVLCPDARLPIVAVCVLYRVGARDDPAGRTGLAHLMEHMMFQGSARVRPNEHVEYVRDAGGTANGDTTLESTHFTQTMPANYLEPVLWLEADRMASISGSITEDLLETQRAVVIQERHQRYDNRPMALAWERAVSLAHPEGHPYQHMPAGRLADLRRISHTDVIRFAQRHYAPGNAVLTVVGDIRPESCSRCIGRYFGGLESPEPQALRPALGHETPMPPEITLPGPSDMALSVFRLPAAGGDSVASLAAAALGIGLRFRLMSSSAGPRVGYATMNTIDLDTWPGMAMLEVGAAPGFPAEKAAVAVDEILGQYAVTGPDPVETQLGKHQTTRRWMEAISSVEGKAVDLARSTALLGDPLTRARRALAVGELTDGDVREAARLLHPDRCARIFLYADAR